MEIMGTPKNSINANTLWGISEIVTAQLKATLDIRMFITLINSVMGMAKVVEEIQE